MIYFIIGALVALGLIANKYGKLTEFLGAVVVGISGYLALKKNPSAQTLKEHDDTTQKIHSLDDAIKDNITSIAVEEQKQKDLKKEIANAKETDNTLSTIVDFLNKR